MFDIRGGHGKHLALCSALYTRRYLHDRNDVPLLAGLRDGAKA